MKLDVSCMRYMTKDDYRMLTAIEMGMRNHELVPLELIASIAKLRHGGTHKILSTLLRYKLLHHENQQFNGYRLSYMGYDVLALRSLLQRNVIASVGAQIGVGKESDIFEAQDEHGNELVLKIHRLGRTSFRDVRTKRDYLAGKGKTNWLYMSRLAALKEFAFMQALCAHDFPTPIPIDQNRHIVAMSKVRGFPMAQVKAGNMAGAESIFDASLNILKRLAQCGLVHCDFNEFNLMVDETGVVTLIDFPQMVSTNHHNAAELFNRDLKGLIKFFAMKMRYVPSEEISNLKLEEIEVAEANIDMEVNAAGFSADHNDDLLRFLMRNGYNAEGEGGAKAGYNEDGDKQDEVEERVQEDDRFEKAEQESDGLHATVFSRTMASTGERAGDDSSEYSDLDEDQDLAQRSLKDEEPRLLQGEELSRAREDAKFRLNRGSQGRGGGRGNSGKVKGTRNMTKRINKYGKRVKEACLDF